MTQKAITSEELAAKIDHTLLKPTATEADFEALCQEAATHRFKAVCVPPSWVPHCVRRLQGTQVGTLTVIGFPLGYATTETKAFEARNAIALGASEIDMVINISWLKGGRTDLVERDVREVREACGNIPLKAILETAYLSDEQKLAAALAAERAGASFIKTSTGFATGVAETGARLADIELLRKNLKPGTKIKASGGIRDLAAAMALIRAGADRLGTSAGVAILEGRKNESAY